MSRKILAYTTMGIFLIVSFCFLLPTDAVQAQNEPTSNYNPNLCYFQYPFINPTHISGFHPKVAGGWQGNDVNSDGIISLFANGGIVEFGGFDNVGGGNGFIIRGIGPCSNMIIAAWHDNSSTTWLVKGDKVDPNQILITQGTSGKTFGAHNHFTFMTTEENLCGIPMDQAEFHPNNKYLGDAWVYDIEDVISYCGTTGTVVGNNNLTPSASITYDYANIASPAMLHNIAYWFHMTGSGQTSVTSLSSFDGSITFEPSKTYYAVSMAGGSFDQAIGYQCDGTCAGLNEGMAVCDAVGTFSKFVDENTPSCFVVNPDFRQHSSGYIIPEAGSNWSIAMTAPKGTPLVQDPTRKVTGTADVSYRNDCDQPITVRMYGNIGSTTLELINGNYNTPWQARSSSGTSVPRLPTFTEGGYVMNVDELTLPKQEESTVTETVAKELKEITPSTLGETLEEALEGTTPPVTMTDGAQVVFGKKELALLGLGILLLINLIKLF